MPSPTQPPRYRRLRRAAAALALLAAAGLADAALQPTLSPPLLYAVPVLFAAWRWGFRPAATLTAAGAAIHLGLGIARAGGLPAGLGDAMLFFAALVATAAVVSALTVAGLFATHGRAWRAAAPMQALGARIFVTSPRSEAPPPTADAIVLRMDSGLAFGSGSHPTTRMCVALLEEVVRPGMRVFDLGSGTGILALAAVKLGATAALAADTDPEAVARARENVARNGCAKTVDVARGSLDVAQNAWPDDRFDLVIANILGDVLMELVDEGLPGFVAPGGALLLSGIRAEQAARLASRLAGAGFAVAARRDDGDWVALLALRPN